MKQKKAGKKCEFGVKTGKNGKKVCRKTPKRRKKSSGLSGCGCG